MCALSIHRALAGDERAIRDIADSAYAIYLDRMDKKPFPMLDDYALRIADGQAYVLDDSHGVQGYMVLVPQEDDTLLLDNIAVRPESQKAGYGRMLASWAEQIARDLGKKWIVLYTNEVMRENLQWYPRLGYEEFDRREEKGYSRVYFRKKV